MYSGIHYILSPILNIPVLDMYSSILCMSI